MRAIFYADTPQDVVTALKREIERQLGMVAATSGGCGRLTRNAPSQVVMKSRNAVSRTGSACAILIGALLLVCFGPQPSQAQILDALKDLASKQLFDTDQAFQRHYARGNYPAALIEAQKAEQAVKARFGANHTNYAAALNKLGLAYRARGQYGEAEEVFKRALAIRERAFGANDVAVGQTVNNLALVYLSQGKYAKAEGPRLPDFKSSTA